MTTTTTEIENMNDHSSITLGQFFDEKEAEGEKEAAQLGLEMALSYGFGSSFHSKSFDMLERQRRIRLARDRIAALEAK